MRKNWSDREVALAVGDYFAMLRLELTGHPYNKARHWRALLPRLDSRSKSSVEMKHQNISAVLIDMGMPYIEGYKPLFGYQRSLLPAVVADYLASHPDITEIFRRDAEAPAPVPSVEDILSALEPAPTPTERPPPSIAEDKVPYLLPVAPAPAINYLELAARNEALGAAGETFVMNYERARLLHAGQDTLAEKVEQVSQTVGPAAGFDIRSFGEGGAERFIEVKTTQYGKSTPFFVTLGELRCSLAYPSQYFLYRVFRFRRSPGLFVVPGPLDGAFRLEPSAFMAVLR